MERTVTASGRGEVSVAPDTAEALVGVEVSNENADAALSEANQKIETLTAALVGLGIAEDDITTASFSIWPEYDYNSQSPQLTSFRVSHLLQVKIRDIGQAGDVVAGAVNAGANSVQGVTFSVSDPQAALDRARELAVDNATHKGEELARLAGATLGPIVKITETSYSPVPIERQAVAGEDAASSVPFNPGESSFSIDLEVTWALN